MTPKQQKIRKVLEILQGDKPKAETLKELLVLVNEGLTRQEFLDAVKNILNQVYGIEIKALNKVNKAVLELKDANNTSLQATQGYLGRLKQELEQSINSVLKEQENGLNFIRDKVRNLKGKDGITPIKGIDYFDGKPADEVKIVKDVLDKIPDYEKKIDELKKELETVKLIKSSRGGGISAMGITQAFKWILKTEQPIGLIDGKNIEYTVKDTIFAVLSFSLNGEVICQLSNYTISKNKITFATALPADYAGKDFECKYI